MAAWRDDPNFLEKWHPHVGSHVILGVDGGGTSTICVAVSADWPGSDGSSLESESGDTLTPNDVLGRGVSGSCNRNSVGDVGARAALEDAIADALRACQLPRAAVAAVYLGMSGVDGPADVARVREWLGDIFPPPLNPNLDVFNDSVIALASGTGGVLHGAVLITGTGTIAFGVGRDGRTARAGGGGPVLGDRGRLMSSSWVLLVFSGYALAVEALGVVMRAADGRGPPSSLTAAILTHLHLKSPQDLINWAYRDNQWSRIAALVPILKECAAGGDKEARRVMGEGVAELALSVKAVADALQLAGEDKTSSFPLVLVGGVLSAESRWDVVGALGAELARVVPTAQPVCPQVTPQPQPSPLGNKAREHERVEPAIGGAMLAIRNLRQQRQAAV